MSEIIFGPPLPPLLSFTHTIPPSPETFTPFTMFCELPLPVYKNVENTSSILNVFDNPKNWSIPIAPEVSDANALTSSSPKATVVPELSPSSTCIWSRDIEFPDAGNAINLIFLLTL